MIIADYDSTGRMTSVKASKAYEINGYGVAEIPAGATAEITYDVSGLSTNGKVMLINDYSLLTPLAQAN